MHHCTTIEGSDAFECVVYSGKSQIILTLRSSFQTHIDLGIIV